MSKEAKNLDMDWDIKATSWLPLILINEGKEEYEREWGSVRVRVREKDKHNSV